MRSLMGSYPTPTLISPMRFKGLRPKRLFGDISTSGIWLFILCLLLAASAVRALRVELGGLSIHPYLFLLLPLLLLAAPPRITRFPQRVLVALVAFEFFYILSIAIGVLSYEEILKIGAAGSTVVTTAVLVRTKSDFRAAVLALSITTTALSIYNIFYGGDVFGLSGTDRKGIADKNALSLYVLPGLLLASDLMLDRTVSKKLRVALAACTLIMTISIFSSGNRSGWVGALCIGVMIYGRGRRVRSTIMISVIALSAYYAVVHYTDTTEVARRINQTVEGNSADVTRWDIMSKALVIGVENPLFGLSPAGLSRELARQLPRNAVLVGSLGNAKVLDPHNVILHILGSSGIITLGLFAYLGWQLWKRPRFASRVSNISGGTSCHALLRMLLVLWFVRGMFSREILYSPSFSVGLGLTVGLCMFHGVWNTRSRIKAMNKTWLHAARLARRHSAGGR